MARKGSGSGNVNFDTINLYNSSHNNFGSFTAGPDVCKWIEQNASPSRESIDLPKDRFMEEQTKSIMSKKAFVECIDEGSCTLIIHGRPGVGKTTAAKGILKRLDRTEQETNQPVVAIALFCDTAPKLGRAVPTEQDIAQQYTPSRILLRILAGLYLQIPEVASQVVHQLYEKSIAGAPDPTATSAAVETVLLGSRRVCLFVDGADAWDDLSDNVCQQNLRSTLEIIKALQREHGLTVVLTDRVAGRQTWQNRLCNIRTLSMEEINPLDIKEYYERQLPRSELNNQHPIYKEVKDVIIDASDGIILLVYLAIIYVQHRGLHNMDQVRSNVENIERAHAIIGRRHDYGDYATFAFDQLHKRYIARMVHDPDDQTHTTAYKTMRFVRDARRSLELGELIDAIDHDSKASSTSRRWSNKWPDIHRECAGLIVIKKSSKLDRLSPVSFYHGTLRAALSDKKAKYDLPDSNIELGRLCVSYLVKCPILLQFATGDSVREDIEKLIERRPFLKYAVRHWPYHLASCSHEDNSFTASADYRLFLDEVCLFLEKDENITRSMQVESCVAKYEGFNNDYTLDAINDEGKASCWASICCERTTGLHIAAALGHKVLVTRLLHQGIGSDRRDAKRRTALHIAADFNRLTIVDLLLQPRYRVDRNAVDVRGLTPLLVACLRGHTDIVKRLLQDNAVNTDFQVHISSRFDSEDQIAERRVAIPGSSALHILTTMHNMEAINAVLGRSLLSINLRDMRNRSPLDIAAAEGNLEMVKLLAADRLGWESGFGERMCTPLHWASGSDACFDVVGYLLHRFPGMCNATDSQTRTALHYAVERSALRNTKLLLGSGMDVNVKDDDGNTALMIAVAGDIELVQLFDNEPRVIWKGRNKRRHSVLEETKQSNSSERVLAIVKRHCMEIPQNVKAEPSKSEKLSSRAESKRSNISSSSLLRDKTNTSKSLPSRPSRAPPRKPP